MTGRVPDPEAGDLCPARAAGAKRGPGRETEADTVPDRGAAGTMGRDGANVFELRGPICGLGGRPSVSELRESLAAGTMGRDGTNGFEFRGRIPRLSDRASVSEVRGRDANEGPHV